MSSRTARSYAFLSIAAAIVTIALKFGAYLLTGSVGLLSDAIESIVNLVAALIALWALTYAAKPADAEHAFGHSKAEYFSSGAEGALIVVAAISIAVEAWGRLLHPEPLTQLGLGLALSLFATAINGVVAFVLLRAGRRLRSITLRADAHHLFTDVVTSGGVVVGIFLVKVTGAFVLDSIVALIVAANITWTGFRLLRETSSALLDAALPKEEIDAIESILNEYKRQHIQFHALRTRTAGNRSFVSFHVLVPGSWTVQQGHDLCEAIELAILRVLPLTHITTHLEPLEDRVSWEDQELERASNQQMQG
ncbi:MAG: cation diffusion facilitator family transporter [Brasilonema octagenarum HA4186-MV1]|jgi:cation diffusion facilitator family transporter|uniref:Cation-efflux pump n=2 Tax=Brasilonema TaxID=383614 RepID=A0A856MGI3_9CYAN|nr:MULTISPECIES: cation diffusion facilitator family transporter [Brasilonema]MBW4627351.1 cation diffusion facilitator family transporter [Brasilonema octagenarum HA4186-MV1]NMF64013.1 cation-efflux pump [Brasilonema octagenarum UFV-OR1]QDL09279.1 cation-efflux pump [Brasilonema sennae CENA114]QDL15636.1 cation-efflux pump [Brasilonema octagenarum UFV-E1]